MTVEEAEDAYVAAYGKWQGEAWREPRTLKYRLFGNPYQGKWNAAAKALELARKQAETPDAPGESETGE